MENRIKQMNKRMEKLKYVETFETGTIRGSLKKLTSAY